MRLRIFAVIAVLVSGCVFSSSNPPKPIGDDDMSAPDAGEDAEQTDGVTVCGDGQLQPTETCDPGLSADAEGACPETCDDGVACTSDAAEGSPDTCDVVCVSEPITVCADGDGCCPDVCDASTDDDCASDEICGDGQVTGTESCDTAIASGAESCPATGEDCSPMACETATVVGSACEAACEYAEITACSGDTSDGCCPASCSAIDDVDCEAMCGNMVVEPPEICDGNCPDGCDDGVACTTDVLTGDPSTCDVACIARDITMCEDGDGCCPMGAGCNALNDDDCAPQCGNMVREGAETCDGDCPVDCDDGVACTEDSLTGTAADCDVACTNAPITRCTDGDGCCPNICDSTTDDDCPVSCGDNVVDGDEKCDGNCPTAADCEAMGACYVLTGDATSCSAECIEDPGCVACDRNATCPCGDGQECVDGRCEDGSGLACTLACNQDRYCSVHGGGGWECNPATNQCVSCLPVGATETSCADGNDDDCDGFVDCDDADCPASQCGHTLAVTERTYNGNLGGRSGADAKCASQANAYGLDPDHTWKAVLSAGGQSASQAINTQGPVYRLDGQLLTSGSLWSSFSILIQKFDQTVFSEHSPAWTGATADGGTSPTHCSSWTAGGALQFGGIGNAGATGTFWLDAGCANNPQPLICNRCDQGNHLYCINRQ